MLIKRMSMDGKFSRTGDVKNNSLFYKTVRKHSKGRRE